MISYFQIDVAGVAICPLCLNEKLSYGNRGLPALADHVKTRKHYSRLIERIENCKISCASEPIDDEMYGAPPAFFHGDKKYKSRTPVLPSVHLIDRISNMEAMLVAFLAEKSLPFSMAGIFIRLSVINFFLYVEVHISLYVSLNPY